MVADPGDELSVKLGAVKIASIGSEKQNDYFRSVARSRPPVIGDEGGNLLSAVVVAAASG